MKLDDAIKKRHSVRRFLTKKPDWRDILECIDACRYAPMAGNIYSVKFVVVNDRTLIQKLADASQQPFVAQAHYVVVVCSDLKKTLNAYDARGKKYCTQQAGSAIQNFLLKIEEKKLATCWIGHFVDHMVKQALLIPDDVEVEALFPIGYEFGKTPKKPKTDFNRILYFNRYKNKKMNKVKKIDI